MSGDYYYCIECKATDEFHCTCRTKGKGVMVNDSLDGTPALGVLSDDQNLKESPQAIGADEGIEWSQAYTRGYYTAQSDMLKAGFRRIVEGE